MGNGYAEKCLVVCGRRRRLRFSYLVSWVVYWGGAARIDGSSKFLGVFDVKTEVGRDFVFDDSGCFVNSRNVGTQTVSIEQVQVGAISVEKMKV